jgi:hypothetical protein
MVREGSIQTPEHPHLTADRSEIPDAAGFYAIPDDKPTRSLAGSM